MYRIGVLSDTHLAASGEALAFLDTLAASHFAGVDMILHAGDIVDPEVLLAFNRCPVLAVRGNMDPSAPDLPQRRLLEIGSVRIGLMHGWGSTAGLEERLLGEFRDDPIDVLVYGHSHRPVCHHRDGVLLFNPGSAADRRRMPHHSVGILEIGRKVKGRIITID